MAKLTVREAVKVYRVSRPTLTKALKSGKLSGVRDGQGHWKIDPSELSRVYEPRIATVSPEPGEPLAMKEAQDPALAPQIEIERLKSAVQLAEARADSAERLADELSRHVEDLRRMLPSPDKPPKQRSRWWPFS